MVFPFQLAHVFSVAFEEELSTEWNSASLVSFFAAAAVQNLRAGSAFILNGFIYIYIHMHIQMILHCLQLWQVCYWRLQSSSKMSKAFTLSPLPRWGVSRDFYGIGLCFMLRFSVWHQFRSNYEASAMLGLLKLACHSVAVFWGVCGNTVSVCWLVVMFFCWCSWLLLFFLCGGVLGITCW